MPDIAELANLLLGDHPNSHQWDEAAGPVKEWELCTDGIVEPVKLVQCGAWYAGTGYNTNQEGFWSRVRQMHDIIMIIC